MYTHPLLSSILRSQAWTRQTSLEVTVRNKNPRTSVFRQERDFSHNAHLKIQADRQISAYAWGRGTWEGKLCAGWEMQRDRTLASGTDSQAGKGGKGTGSSSLPQRRRLRPPALLHCHHFSHPQTTPGNRSLQLPRNKGAVRNTKAAKNASRAAAALPFRCLGHIFFRNFTERFTDNAAEGTVFLPSCQELPHSKRRSQDNAGALLRRLAARRRPRLLQQVCELNQLGSHSEAERTG